MPGVVREPLRGEQHGNLPSLLVVLVGTPHHGLE